MNFRPPTQRPEESVAGHLYALLEGVAGLETTVNPTAAQINDQISRNVCMVALSFVGRGAYNQSGAADLARARAGILDYSIALNCYSSVLMWAIVAGAITGVQQNRYVATIAQANKQGGAAGAQAKQAVKAILWDAVGRQGADRAPWAMNAALPLASMVYFGRKGNKLAHVGLYVGHGYVVGSVSPDAFVTPNGPPSPAFLRCNNMLERGWSPFVTAMRVEHLIENNDLARCIYTTVPFWRNFPA